MHCWIDIFIFERHSITTVSEFRATVQMQLQICFVMHAVELLFTLDGDVFFFPSITIFVVPFFLIEAVLAVTEISTTLTGLTKPCNSIPYFHSYTYLGKHWEICPRNKNRPVRSPENLYPTAKFCKYKKSVLNVFLLY